MPVFLLDPSIKSFPDPALAEGNGLLAVGGDLSPERLISAYRSGVFPWYSEGEPLLWFSPDPRMVLRPSEVHVSRSLRRRLRSGVYETSRNRAFSTVIEACRETPRDDQDGTWITADMVRAYTELHRLGVAHSVEVWRNDSLVGGLYGVLVGTCFCGESMFSHAVDASKVAFVALADAAVSSGVEMIDCQLPTDHLASLGAVEVSRSTFLTDLRAAADRTPTERWA